MTTVQTCFKRFTSILGGQKNLIFNVNQMKHILTQLKQNNNVKKSKIILQYNLWHLKNQ